MNSSTGADAHEVVSSLAVRWSETYCTGASLLVCVVSAGVNFIVSPECGSKVVTIDLPPAQYSASRAHGGRDAGFVGKVIQARCYHGDAFINHDFWDRFEG